MFFVLCKLILRKLIVKLNNQHEQRRLEGSGVYRN